MTDTHMHYRNCNICEAMCGLAIEFRDTEIISIKADHNDPFSQGHICPKAIALQDFYSDKDRIRKPIKRIVNESKNNHLHDSTQKDMTWKEITWEEAFQEVVERITAVQTRYGKNALGTYLGNPAGHDFGTIATLPEFFKALGTYNRYSSASVDQMPHHVAANYMFGASMLIPVPDIDRTDFMLNIGANPGVSNGSMMTAPNVVGRLKAIQQRGGKVVVIDPRRTETAKLADQHLFIRPEKDAYVLLAIVNTLFTENLIALNHLGSLLEGVDKLQRVAEGFHPTSVAEITGITAAEIMELTRHMAAAKSAVCYSRMGASTQTFGGLCQWLTNAINILMGNCDSEGGAMFTLPAFDSIRHIDKNKKNPFGKYHSRVRKLPYLNGEFPVATLADEILTEGEGQIRAMITVAANPVLTSPNGARLAEAFKQLDFLVCVDIYLNETTQHADIILPATSGLECSYYDIYFNAFAVRNTAKYSPYLFEKTDTQRHDWEILKEISHRITGTENNGVTPEAILDYELRNGPYGHQGMSLEKLKQHPHGFDLGPLKPNLIKRLKTQDGKIHIAPELFLNDIPRLHQQAKQDAQTAQHFPFQLIGRRLPRSHNSWTQNSYRLIKGKNPCTLFMHSHDAKYLGVNSGDKVNVISAIGELHIEVAINDDMLPGVLSMPQGWGHNQPNTAMHTAATQPGVSMNALTDTQRIDTLTGTAALNGTWVRVEQC